jgi:hypothetical protein
MTAKCDFCGANEPQWRYACSPFKMLAIGEKDGTPASVTFNSDAEWAACNDCREIIERDGRSELAERVLRLVPTFDFEHATTSERKFYLDMLLQFHGTFFNTKGDPVPLRAGDWPEYEIGRNA